MYVCMYNIQIIYIFDHIRVECSYCMHVREAMWSHLKPCEAISSVGDIYAPKTLMRGLQYLSSGWWLMPVGDNPLTVCIPGMLLVLQLPMVSQEGFPICYSLYIIIWYIYIYIYIYISMFFSSVIQYLHGYESHAGPQKKKRGPVAWCQGAPTMVDVQPPTGVILW